MTPAGYRKVSDLPEVIPVFPLDGALLLPGCVLPLQIFEPRYLNMIDDAMAGDRLIGMIQTGRRGVRTRVGLARVGCAGRITSYSETGDGRYLIALTGVCRFESGEELPTPAPYRRVTAAFGAFEDDLDTDDDQVEFERAPFLDVLRRYLDQRGLGIEWDVVAAAPGPSLINSLCMALPLDPAEKQALLEAPALDERRAALCALLEIGAATHCDEDDDRPPSMQ
ncbi:MAG: LON peptidase substrate-binding domain-containing protein [Caulobacteraceae bacterium]